MGQEWLGKLLTIVFGLLMPPKSDDPIIRRYQWTVSTLLIGVYVIGVFLIVLATGQMPALSHGVAMSDDLETLKLEASNRQADTDSRMKNIQAMILHNSLKQALHDSCAAIASGNQPALDAANADLDSLTDLYTALTGRQYQRLPCDVVLIKSTNNK